MRAAIAALAVAACYSPDHRQWGNPDAGATVTLTVAIMGAGEVTIQDVGTCAHPMCTFAVPAQAMLKLEASAMNDEHPFVGWTSGCTGKIESCSLPPVMANTLVGAKFQ